MAVIAATTIVRFDRHAGDAFEVMGVLVKGEACIDEVVTQRYFAVIVVFAKISRWPDDVDLREVQVGDAKDESVRAVEDLEHVDSRYYSWDRADYRDVSAEVKELALKIINQKRVERIPGIVI